MPLSDEQIAQRRHLITASDAAAICGVLPWRNAFDVYAEKKGQKDPWPGNWKTRRGDAVEPLLLAWLGEQKAPLVVKPSGTKTLVHSAFSWLGATPDAMVYDGGGLPIAVGEAKSSGMIAEWTDEAGELAVPDYYLVQATVQMAVCSVARAFVVVELLGGDSQDPEILTLERDDDLAAIIIQECDRFRKDHLEANRPPEPDGSANAKRMLAALYPRHTRDMLVTTAETELLGRTWLEAKKQENDAIAVRKTLEAKLCSHIGEHEGVAGEGWRALWTWREPSEVKAHVRAGYRAFDCRAVGQGRKRKVA